MHVESTHRDTDGPIAGSGIRSLEVSVACMHHAAAVAGSGCSDKLDPYGVCILAPQTMRMLSTARAVEECAHQSMPRPG